MDNSPSIISHISIGTNDFERAIAFYDQVLPTLGCKRLMEYPGAIAYGKQYPEFWVQTPIDGRPATVGNGTHVGFIAPTKEAVHAFYEAALAAGGKMKVRPVLDPNTASHTTAVLFATWMDIKWKQLFGMSSLFCC